MSPFRNQPSRRVQKLLVGFAAVLAVALIFSTVSRAEFDLGVSHSEEDKASALLKFQYRLFPAAEVETFKVTQNGTPLEFRHTPFANNPLNTSAILVLVDVSTGSSKAPRDRTIACNKQFIQALLAKAQSRDLVGVSSFANDLVDVAPVGAPFSEIRNNIGKLKADGLGTRIYLQGIHAIQKLMDVQASRKALIILSDGKDEDNGFTIDDLLKAAIKQGVMVFAMGCPETGADVPALGNLEKIAAETHGLYTRARMGSADSEERLKADAAFAQAVLDSVASGGEVVVPLAAADPAGEILFEAITKGSETLRYVHKRPAAAQPVSAQPTATPAESTPAIPVAATPRPTPSPVPPPAPVASPVLPKIALPAPKPEVVAPTALDWAKGQLTLANLISASSLTLLVVAVLVLRRRKPESIAPDSTPVAYLQMQDAESKRILLAKTANRIGRRPDNDIVFANTSISGYHAEIHAQRDGTYYITDLGSGNGLIVNEQRLTQSDLKDGDLIELGEVRFRFHRG